jgi:hypothetical protein
MWMRRMEKGGVLLVWIIHLFISATETAGLEGARLQGLLKKSFEREVSGSAALQRRVNECIIKRPLGHEEHAAMSLGRACFRGV